jgi:CPA1 family monovalent cation:H+ antiporter
MVFALLVSLVAVLFNAVGWIDLRIVTDFLKNIDFSEVLLHGMLSFLLFAGALHINLEELKSVKWPVSILATIGTMLSTFIIGSLVWLAAGLTGFELSYIYALLFGALISPTDPIAVLSILKQVGASKKMYVKIGGESLFNDGVGVVIFLTILGIATGSGKPEISHVLTHFIREAFGGFALGGLFGWITYILVKSIDDYKTEALLTIALVIGGYAFAEFIHVSAPISMVVAGLIVGNQGRSLGMSDITREHLDLFWELIDEILNAVLFMLIGLEIIIISINLHHMYLGALAIVAVLLGRLISVSIPMYFIGMRHTFEKGTIALLTWGGLRGGLSIAMALSLPAGDEKSIILPITYIVVLFSILVQGLSFKRIAEIVTRK